MNPAAQPCASQQAAVEAALVLLERMGLSLADLTAVPQDRPGGADLRRVRPGRVGGRERRLPPRVRLVLEPGRRALGRPAPGRTPSEIRQLMAYVKTHVVARRNARGGRSAEEHLVAALRCLYQRAVDDGLIAEADNPARKRPRACRCGEASVTAGPA